MYLSEPGGFHTDSSFFLASNNAVAIPNLAGFWDVMSTVLHFLSVKYLTGLGHNPGGDYIHSVCRHRQVVPQSCVKYHGLPGPPSGVDHEFSGMKN
jgi:hypothetical protein